MVGTDSTNVLITVLRSYVHIARTPSARMDLCTVQPQTQRLVVMRTQREREKEQNALAGHTWIRAYSKNVCRRLPTARFQNVPPKDSGHHFTFSHRDCSRFNLASMFLPTIVRSGWQTEYLCTRPQGASDKTTDGSIAATAFLCPQLCHINTLSTVRVVTS